MNLLYDLTFVKVGTLDNDFAKFKNIGPNNCLFMGCKISTGLVLTNKVLKFPPVSSSSNSPK